MRGICSSCSNPTVLEPMSTLLDSLQFRISRTSTVKMINDRMRLLRPYRKSRSRGLQHIACRGYSTSTIFTLLLSAIISKWGGCISRWWMTMRLWYLSARLGQILWPVSSLLPYVPLGLPGYLKCNRVKGRSSVGQRWSGYICKVFTFIGYLAHRKSYLLIEKDTKQMDDDL